jgi:tripartite ATP-independent transporter DctM subunit
VVIIVAKSIPILILPIIMVGGIVSGVFTPAESGCAAVLYALFAGFFITRELTWKKVFEAAINTALTTGVVFFLVAVVFASLWFLNLNELSTLASNTINEVVSTQFQFLLLVMAIYLVAGLFLDPDAGIIMFVPVLLPIAMHYGITPIQFGLLSCLAMFIGLVTPPVGLCLFLAGDIAKTSIDSIFRAALPLIVLEFIVLIIVAFFPESYMWVPNLFYK